MEYLTGNNQEKAKQLLELLNTKELSLEQLKEIVPMTNDFLKSLGDVLKEQIKNDNSRIELYNQAFSKTMDFYQEALKGTSLSEKQRDSILEAVIALNKNKDTMIQQERESSERTKKLTIFLSFIVIILVIITGGNSRKK